MRPILLIALALPIAGCANDKTLHFVAGAATSKYVTQRTHSPLNGCVAALAAGIAKEAYDSRMGGNVTASDALATAAGCAYTMRF